jgi:hypothetical protein
LAKSVLAVTLTKRAMVLDGHAYKETERVSPENKHKFLRLGPDPVFVVTK